MITRRTLPLLAAAIAGLLLFAVADTTAYNAGAAAAFKIDMNASASPGNTATSLGTIETCARLAPNGIQDADEDAVDAVSIDVVVNAVPSSTAMIAFSYTLLYDESALTLQAYQGGFFLAADPDSSLFQASEDVPDVDMNNKWIGTEADIGVTTDASESGYGVLQRITLQAKSTGPGVYDLILSDTVHADPTNTIFEANSRDGARLTVNTACPPTDTDGDGVYDADEAQCGSGPSSAALRPERIDGVFAGVDDDGDTQIDEALPANIPMADCDGDGFTGTAENLVYSPSTQGDQDPCGTAPSSAPFNVPIGWPADLRSGGIPNSTNKINVGDITSFLAPVRRLDTSPGDAGYDSRWDVVPGNSGQAKDINSVDYNYVSNFAPAMLHGVRAMNGPPCPWPQ